jgi:hypothetical protein
MSAHHHHPSARSRAVRRSIVSPVEDDCRLWLPPTGRSSIVIEDIADAGLRAFDLFHLGVRDAVLVTMDKHRVLTAALLDPQLDLSWMFATLDTFELPIEVSTALLVVHRAQIIQAPPSDEDTELYWSMHDTAADHGVEMLDVMLANPRMMQSLGIVCDPASVWHIPFDPDAA